MQETFYRSYIYSIFIVKIMFLFTLISKALVNHLFPQSTTLQWIAAYKNDLEALFIFMMNLLMMACLRKSLVSDANIANHHERILFGIYGVISMLHLYI